VLAAYTGLLNRGQAAANLPLQQWQGPTIAGFNPTQRAAFDEVNAAQGMALPWVNAATQYAGIGAAPVLPSVMGVSGANIQQFQNPFTQQVTQAAQQLFNEQNAEQLQNVVGDAVSRGAWGGDRAGVAQAELARQQALAQNPALAQILQQGYGQALQELNTQQQLQLQGGEGDAWRAANAAAQLSGLGEQAQAGQLAGASAQLQVGSLGQQLQQQELNAPIAQFQQQQAFPYQTTNFLQGLVEGIGPAFGGSSATTAPGPNLFGQAAGLGISGLGVANQLGAFSGSDAASVDALATTGGGNALETTAGMVDTIPPSRRGGRVRRVLGGLVPGFTAGLVPGMTANDVADVNAAVAMAGASPVRPLAPSSAHGLPFTSPSSTTMGSGGGQDNTLQTIGTLASIAAIAASDPALKHVKGKTGSALDRIRGLEVRDARYRWEPPRTERPMLMADNVGDVLPQAVSGKAPVRMINMNEIVPTLVQGIKELDRRTGRASGGMVGAFGGSGASMAPLAPNPGAAPPAMVGVDPRLQQLYARYAQLPIEQLQRLAVMTSAASPQGQMVQRALRQKQLAPASTRTFPSTAPQVPGFPDATTGVVAPGYADGGNIIGTPIPTGGDTGDGPLNHPTGSRAVVIDMLGPGSESAHGGVAPGTARMSFASSPGYGIALPRIEFNPSSTGALGPTWAPGQALLSERSPITDSPAGFGVTPAVPPLVTQLPASVASPSVAFAPPTPPVLPGFGPQYQPYGANGWTIPSYRRGGLVPHLSVGGFDAGDDTVDGQRFDLSDPLIRLGAAMMASRSPFPLTQLGEGLGFAARSAPQRPYALAHRRFYTLPILRAPAGVPDVDPVNDQPP
jgi:hypothetical protein